MLYRQAAKTPIRVRNETGALPVRTLTNMVEIEGGKVQEEIIRVIKDILYDNDFSEYSIPNNEANLKAYIPNRRKIIIYHKAIEVKIKEHNIEKIEKQLWIGKVDVAIKILNSIDKENLKSQSNIERLIGYFERNRVYIPCYTMQKSLRLRNLSNKAENANDLLVASRQKHNGISWSKNGSVALAIISTIYKNNEQKNWQEKSKIEAKFVL